MSRGGVQPGSATVRCNARRNRVAEPSWDDQGMLNAVVENWCELDPTWNVQLLNLAVLERLPPTEISQRLLAERRTLVDHGAVLHFVGPNPWSTKSTVDRAPAEWVAALLRSGWYSPLQAVLWLAIWLCGWIPRRCVLADQARAPSPPQRSLGQACPPASASPSPLARR